MFKTNEQGFEVDKEPTTSNQLTKALSDSHPLDSDEETGITLTDIENSINTAPFESTGVIYENTEEFIAHLKSQPLTSNSD